MDLNRLISMIVNRVIGRVVNLGISKGIDMASRRGKPAGDLTPADRQQADAAREAAKRARKAAQITRRLGAVIRLRAVPAQDLCLGCAAGAACLSVPWVFGSG